MATTFTSEDLRRLIGRLDADGIRCFQGATALCQSRAQYEITPDHLLMRLLDDTSGDVARIVDTFKVDRGQVRRALSRALDELPTGHRGKPALSPKVVELFQSAGVLTDELGLSAIRTGMLMLAIALNPSHTRVPEFSPELERINADQLRDHFREIVVAGGEAGGAGTEAGAGGPMGGVSDGALAQFTVDLTAKAAAGQIDPVFGRDHEIRQMIDIFARRRKNNPILVGEPGTGKTAIVEGLALRIVDGDVPPALKGVKLISLDLGLLQAGAGVKGEFENRLKNVIKEIKASKEPVITFIDEAHTLIGAGGAAGGADAANLLKPALARGELRTVAATTWAEYKKYFEKDAALERRFQLVRCDEPNAASATVMLRGLKDKYEKHHKVVMLDEAVSAAVNLSMRYISGRFLPDKAVDLLDTSAARVAVALTTTPGRLEDVDRQLGYLETARAAVERDHASGMPIDEAKLREMDEQRTKLMAEREQIEKRWQEEKAAVDRVIELRAKLYALIGTHDAAETVGAKDGSEAKAKTDGSVGSDGSGKSDGSAKAEKSARKPAKPGETAKPSETAKREPSAEELEVRRQIDEAMNAMRRIQGDEPMLHAQVDAGAVGAVVADWTGIPVGSMVKDEITAILEMEDRLRGRVVGQDHALKIVAEKLRGSRAGIGNPDQPMGVFLCVGPSGVGKTELGLAIADLLFGGERFLTTINMSEFMEKHTVSQLKGSPPGYVGYGEGGVLTEAVRQHPYSVVLLDEVEKAHPDVLNLFYQVFDKGNLADGEGRVINFKNTVIIMTSNLGTDVIQSLCESGEAVDMEALKEGIYPHLREHFKPALVARMTVIPFFTLKPDVLKNIAKLKVRKLTRRIREAHKIDVTVEDAVYETIAARCTQVDVGARAIDHVLDQSVMPELSKQLLQKMTEDTMPKTMTFGAGADGVFTYAFA